MPSPNGDQSAVMTVLAHAQFITLAPRPRSGKIT
jgi:hypothetical protein